MKHIKKITIIAASVFFLSACAQKIWVNPSVTEQQAKRDFADCEYDTVKHGHVDMWGSGVGAGIEEGLRKNEIMTSCMTSKGYRLEAKQDMTEQQKAIDQKYAQAIEKHEEKMKPIQDHIVNVCRPQDDAGYISCISEKKNAMIEVSLFPEVTTKALNERKEIEQQLVRKEITREKFKELATKIHEKEMKEIQDRAARDIKAGTYTAKY